MTQTQLAKRGYQTVKRELASEKNIEFQVFASITSRMRAVDMNQADGMVKLSEALIDNAKLWNILYIDLLNPQNPLPLDLKNSLLSLSEFTQKQTHKILQGEATHDVLIDINNSVIDGLRSAMKSDRTDLASEAA